MRRETVIVMAQNLESNKHICEHLGIVMPMDRPWLRCVFRSEKDYPNRCDSEQCTNYGIVLKPNDAVFILPNGAGSQRALVAQCPRCEAIYYQLTKQEKRSARNA